MNSAKIQSLVKEMLSAFGENPEREGLIDTPKRVAKSYNKLLEGYNRNFADEITVFENTHSYNQIIVSGKIDFVSLCEHHLLPFYGYAHVGYVPDKKIVGLSKLSRIVDIYSRRLQDQERITIQVTQEIMNILQPKGVAAIFVGQHFCNIARGVQKKDSYMTTVIYKGIFETDQSLQRQFLELIKISENSL
ncbi:GTP cyclohydrolase I FolE [Candidatus Uabimicrobium sp. HlEnr_7]|uniref:GTP cyclohydrolase I FolE n=1 Tax=Candidatus Uabimicrobium helgolandensis TaxID=3095367 RepID=UPI003555F550